MARFDHQEHSLPVPDWNSRNCFYSLRYALLSPFSKPQIKPKRKRRSISCLIASNLRAILLVYLLLVCSTGLSLRLSVICNFPVRTFSGAAWLPCITLSFTGAMTFQGTGCGCHSVSDQAVSVTGTKGRLPVSVGVKEKIGAGLAAKKVKIYLRQLQVSETEAS